MTHKEEASHLIHELYPDVEVLDYRPFPPIENAIIVWEKETYKEYIFIPYLTYEPSISEKDGTYSKHFDITGHLFITDQHLWENYMTYSWLKSPIASSINDENNEMIKEDEPEPIDISNILKIINENENMEEIMKTIKEKGNEPIEILDILEAP